MLYADEWYARKARRIFQERSIGGNEQIGSKLLAEFQNPTGSKKPLQFQLRATWALYFVGAATENWLLEQTEHPDEHMRAWAVRLLADGLNEITPAITNRFLKMATQGESSLVRLYLASSLRRLDNKPRMEVASALCQHEPDAGDRVQPHMIWFGIP